MDTPEPSTPEPPPPEVPSYEDGKLTVEKAKWIEEQANRALAFHIESWGLLSKAAETTLGWLFGIAVGAAGYVGSHFSDEPWRILVPLMAATAGATYEAANLIRGAMMAEDVPSPGNTANNIAGIEDERLKYKEEWMRLAEAKGLDSIIEAYVALNIRRGKAINRARRAVVLIPTLTLAVLVAFAVGYWLAVGQWP